MDYQTTRAVFMVVMLLLFVGIVVWAYSGRQRNRFDAAAQLPLQDELEPIGHRAGREEHRK